MGITDRTLIENLTELVIRRLDRAVPFPGMEDMAPHRASKESEPEIMALVKEILSQKEKAPVSNTQTVPEKRVKLTPNALTVLERRYFMKDAQGNLVEKTPEDMFRRVARNVASADLFYDSKADVAAAENEFLEVMADLEFLPNSPTLMNAGRELQQLSACFVLPVEDSMEAIFEAVKQTALIHKSGGGTGFSFSRLRPEGDKVGSTGGVASGPVSFMRAFDTATDVTKQGGTRRGANMGILNINHPDILKFINAKGGPNAFVNFNISVAVTLDFMEKVERGEDYELINPRTGQVSGKLNARDVFNKIVEMAWRTGDPGVVFIDRINEANPTPHLGKIESTNPCGEQPLLPYESCNLGSINLAKMVKAGSSSKLEIDGARIARVVKTAVHFLDNVIDMNRYPIPQIEKMTKGNRKIGLGVMGFSDMLVQMGIPYDSEEALTVGEKVMSFISQRANEASVEMATARGVFPNFHGSVYDRPGGLRVRNATRTTIAPTGTLSIIAGVSSGIEPLFALVYERHILDNERFLEVNPFLEEVAKGEGFYSPELMQELAKGKCLRDIFGVPEWVRKVFVTAHDITPEWHVKMQAAFQKYTDNAVSKTVNFASDATLDDVAKVYRMAHKLGLKGITIYRDRSKEGQVLTVGSGAPAEEAEHAELHASTVTLTPRERPEVTTGYTRKMNTGCGNLYVTVNSDGQGICEVFTTLGKAGGCASAQLEALSRMISVSLRSGLEPASMVKMLKGIRCPSLNWQNGRAVLSCADAIGTVLENYLKQGAAVAPPQIEKTSKAPEPKKVEFGPPVNLAGQCPDCGALLVYQEGCFYCGSCGYTKC
ncbi:MAG: vitamin B12-dependent ribonucleotide reductase [Chloroflexi bacterium]|nr:vitamin B12-dependent ribonucleotide reductase [Chloroflexota bacterium]